MDVVALSVGVSLLVLWDRDGEFCGDRAGTDAARAAGGAGFVWPERWADLPVLALLFDGGQRSAGRARRLPREFHRPGNHARAADRLWRSARGSRQRRAPYLACPRPDALRRSRTVRYRPAPPALHLRLPLPILEEG